MRTVQMEYLRPREIAEERERCSIVYLPVAPLEWHGPAMPFGVDPLMAQEWARRSAKITGGVVMPTLFCGTERERPADILKAKGFEDAENLYVLGMDVPKTSVKSFYAKEDLFAITVREYLRLLVMQKYKLIVIVNGHGAWGQIGTLERLCAEFSGETDSKVITYFPSIEKEGEPTPDFGHGTLIETALMRYLYDEHIDLSEYPSRDVPLPYTDYGIADDSVFQGIASPDNCVIFDPRDATKEIGEKYFNIALDHLVEQVEAAYQSL